LGWIVVWILHDRRFNQIRLSAAEMALRTSLHFYSNMDELGSGIIYDQFDVCDKGVRYGRLPPLPIDIREYPKPYSAEGSSYFLSVLTQRAIHCKFFFKGDLMSVFLNSPTSFYLQQALQNEKRFKPSSDSLKWSQRLQKIWKEGIVNLYLNAFRYFLERSCR
jgi:competence protein CoiA